MKHAVIAVMALLSIVGLSRAQTGYTLTSVTGGAVTGYDQNNNATTWPFGLGSNGYGGGGGGSNGANINSTPIVFTFTWGGAGDSPATVILTVTGSATWTGHGGSVDDGLGDLQILTAPPYPPGLSPYMGSSGGTHYFIKSSPGTTFTCSISPSGSTAGGSVGGNWNVTVTDVVVTDSSAIAPGGHAETLVGQQQVCNFSAGGFRFATAAHPAQYSWDISGSPRIFWTSSFGPTMPNPQSHSWTLLPSGAYSAVTLLFFGGTGGSDTVSCSAPVYDPSGNNLGNVTGSLSLTIVTPGDHNDELYPGASWVETTALGTFLDSGQPGMSFNFEVQTPADFRSAEGYGQDSVVQLVSPYFDFLMPSGWDTPYQPSWGLDNQYAYAGPFTAGGGSDQTDDTPRISLRLTALAVQVNFQFGMFLTFTPPAPPSAAGVEDIPLEEDLWDWVCFDTGNGAGSWNNPQGEPTATGADIPGFDQFVWSQVLMNTGS